MSSLVERNFTVVLRIVNAILQGRADAWACSIALSAQADQVSAELRAAEAGFDATPDDRALRRIFAARAAFCGQVAGERFVEAYAVGGTAGIEDAFAAFDLMAGALVRFVNDRALGNEGGAVAAVEQACAMLPPDRRAMLSR
jgi:hypothetical protein